MAVPTPRCRWAASTVTALRCNVCSNEPRRCGSGNVNALGHGVVAISTTLVVYVRFLEGLQEILAFGRMVEADGEARSHALDGVEFVIQGDRDLDVLDTAATKAVPSGSS